jgi:6-phosphogluconolactonase
MIFHLLSSPAEFWSRALDQTLAAIRKALELHPTCRLGLAGGSTPRPLYAALAAEKLPWERMQIILIDERQVPPNHPESNRGMVRQALLDPVAFPIKNLFCFDVSLPPGEAAEKMEAGIKRLLLERRPLFDFLVLGAGTDGHIASLFFGQRDLVAQKAFAVESCASGYPVEQRLTLTLKALQDASGALLLLKGREKQPVAEALRTTGALQYPALMELASSLPLETLALL